MIEKDLFNPLNSNKLVGLDNYFNELINFYESNNFPKVLLLSGKKGFGKFTLTIHFLNFIFSKKTYNLEEKSFDIKSSFYKKLINGVSENVIFLRKKNNESIKVDDIRNLKSIILKSSINNEPRFFILDDVEKFNINSSNALLKILEEPSKNNFFILIDNKENRIIETISSRCLKINIFTNKANRERVINYLLKKHNVDNVLNFDHADISPGLFLKYNYLFLENEIYKEHDFLSKLEKLLNLYKKTKDPTLINLSIYFTESYFYTLYLKKINEPLINDEVKNKIIHYINNFVKYNLNLKSVYSSIKSQFNNAK